MLSSNGKMVTASLSPDTDTGKILQGRGRSPASRNGDYESSGSGDCFYSIMTLFAIKNGAFFHQNTSTETDRSPVTMPRSERAPSYLRENEAEHFETYQPLPLG